MPYRFVNLRSGDVSGNVNVLAEIGTCVTELGDLSRLTGDPKYVAAAKAAQKAVFDRRSALDLVGTSIDVETGAWVDSTSTMNPPVDSFLEYLSEGFRSLGDRDLLRICRTLITAFLRRQTVEINGRTGFTSAGMDTGLTTSIEQSELAASRRLPHPARGPGPGHAGPPSKGNQLRPEYVDSAFNLWLTTGDRRFVDLAAEYYINRRATSRVVDASGGLVGYTILDDVTVRPERQAISPPPTGTRTT